MWYNRLMVGDYMKNHKNIKIEEIFDLNEQLFNSLSWNQNGAKGFGTGWIINSPPTNSEIDLLELNGNKSKYIEFIEKNFYKPLEYIFNSKSLGRNLVPYLYLEENADGEMKLTFNSFNVFGTLYLSSLIAESGPSFDDLVKSFSNLNEMFEYLKDIFKEERKVLKTTKVNVLKNNEKIIRKYNETYNFIKSMYGKNISFEEFLENRVSTLNKMISSIKYIIPFFEKNINIEQLYNFIDYDKLCLILAYDFMKYIELIESRDGHVNSCVIYLENYIRTIDFLQDKFDVNYSLSINIGNGIKYNVEQLKKDYSMIIERHPEIQFKEADYEKIRLAFQKIMLDDEMVETISKMNKRELSEFVSNIVLYIDDFISESSARGAENISSTEIVSTIENIKNDIEKGNLSLEEYKSKKHQLDKLNMVFNEIKPKAIQKGLGIFKKFNVYYYDNGMVALDKIEYGARLFLMPITTYKYIVENNIESLRAIGKIDGVKAFKHDERTDWLSNAKEYLKNGNLYSSMDDIKINEDIVSWEFDFSKEDITKLDKIIEKIENNKNYLCDEKNRTIAKVRKLKEKKESIRKKAKKIDEELKVSNPALEEEYKKSDLINIEKELDSKSSSLMSFEELYELEKTFNKKVKRSAAVAKYGKDRTLDIDGMFHCELCNSKYSIEEKTRLDYHHFVPIGQGGPDTIYNGICLCKECHSIIHYEQERISTKTKAEILRKIEQHIREENPELLEEFYEYKKTYFPTINDILFEKRAEIKKELFDEGISTEEYGEEMVSDEIDKRIESFEKKLEEEYQNNFQKYDENFEIDWNTQRNFKR